MNTSHSFESINLYQPFKSMVWVKPFECQSNRFFLLLFRMSHANIIYTWAVLICVWLWNAQVDFDDFSLTAFSTQASTHSHTKFQLDTFLWQTFNLNHSMWSMCDLSILYAKSINVTLCTINEWKKNVDYSKISKKRTSKVQAFDCFCMLKQWIQ